MNFLAGDVGGTKTFLGVYSSENNLVRLHHKKYLSSKWNSMEAMLSNFLETLPSGINPPTNGCIALAGLVSNCSCKLTNLGWYLDQSKLCKIANLISLELINDVSVLLYGIPFLNNKQFVQIQTGINQVNKHKTIAVIAAGTGLGIARGVFDNKKVLVLPSEGGHKEFAPRSTTEWALAEWLKSDLNLNRLSLERIISGTGLGHIARWRLNQSDAISHPLKNISDKWRSSNEVDLPALVSDSAKNGDRFMKEALNIWLSAYGSAAGDLALQELCEGGLWIAGGTTSKQLEGIRSATFLDPMKRKGRFNKYLEELPVMAIIDQEAGLFSAACRARMLAKEMRN